MVTTRVGLCLVALALAAPAVSFAGEAKVSVKVAELRVKPDSTAFSRLKLGAGRPVAVLGKSDDGQWIKVRAEFERGEDVVKLEGWVEANQLKGDLGGLAVASGGETGKGSASSSSSSSSASTDAAWDSGSSSSAASSSGDSGWGDSGAAPAPAAEPAASGDSWGGESAAPAPAAEATPAPDASMGEWDMSEPAPTPTPESKPDEWDSGSGSGDSGSSGDSGDGW